MPTFQAANVGWAESASTLCIGLDLAWFGGAANNPDSQWDCIASVMFDPIQAEPKLALERVHLKYRDPDSRLLLSALRGLLEKNGEVNRILLAVDAPLQAADRGLPDRAPKPTKGNVERRAVDEYLGQAVREVSERRKDDLGWQPKIQPGAPLAPRVIKLREGLRTLGLNPWDKDASDKFKVLIECFPAEAIWAFRCADKYPSTATATCIKAYKKQKNSLLSAEQVKMLTDDSLRGARDCYGLPNHWNGLITQCQDWMLADRDWKTGDRYRGGKLLDDVVDTMLCLCTALAFARGSAHLWQDPESLEDGHIMGPGPWQGEATNA